MTDAIEEPFQHELLALQDLSPDELGAIRNAEVPDRIHQAFMDRLRDTRNTVIRHSLTAALVVGLIAMIPPLHLLGIAAAAAVVFAVVIWGVAQRTEPVFAKGLLVETLEGPITKLPKGRRLEVEHMQSRKDLEGEVHTRVATRELHIPYAALFDALVSGQRYIFYVEPVSGTVFAVESVESMSQIEETGTQIRGDADTHLASSDP